MRSIKKARWLTFHRYDFERGLHDVQSIRVFHEPLLHADRTKVDNQRHLSAIKAGMVAMTPFTILGSIFTIIPALPNMLGPKNAVSLFITSNADLFDLPVKLSIGMIGLYACLSIAYNLGNHYKLYIPGCVTLSGFAFLMMVATFTKTGQLDVTNPRCSRTFHRHDRGLADSRALSLVQNPSPNIENA